MLQRKEREEWLSVRKYCCFKIPAFWHCFGINIVSLGKDSCKKNKNQVDKEEEKLLLKNFSIHLGILSVLKHVSCYIQLCSTVRPFKVQVQLYFLRWDSYDKLIFYQSLILNAELTPDLLSVETFEQGEICRPRVSMLSAELSTKHSSQKLLPLCLHLFSLPDLGAFCFHSSVHSLSLFLR